MKRHIAIIGFVLFFGSCTQIQENTIASDEVAIIPIPLSIHKKEGSFILNNKTSFFYENPSIQPIADFFVSKIHHLTGLQISVRDKKEKNDIQLLLNNELELNEEGYILNLEDDHVIVEAKSPKGIFYGLQSLMQLLPVIPEENTSQNITIDIPKVRIKDEPSFRWRGTMLDVSRHFFSVDFIKKQLDVLAAFKINKFHWHLTDDQGWRIEIKKYPKLVEIGARRGEINDQKYHGFYTQEEIREVVSYAKERFIDVIPEFDIPGHASAILSAYPSLACTEGPFEIRPIWGVDYNILCAGNEHVYQFIEDVIDEMSTLFPYQYFHVGGDEVPKRSWKQCKLCQHTIKKEGLNDENELQSHLMARVEGMLYKNNKKMIGWDEILEGGITATTSIMSWQGEEGGIKAANEGHDVIMTPSQFTYLNFYQGDHVVEPMAFGGYIPLEKVYNYNPVPETIEKNKRHHILGLQGNFWTEHGDSNTIAEYQLYPRILAIAEVGWTSKKNKDYHNFLSRLEKTYRLLDRYNLQYHIPMPEGPITDHIVFENETTIEFRTTAPVKMVYTTDGSVPNKNSNVYTKPLTFNKSTFLKIASILPHGKMSNTRELSLQKQELIPSLENMNNLDRGLNVKTIKGHFTHVNEIVDSIEPIERKITELKDVNVTYDWGHEINKENFKAALVDGYIEIPEDGVYFFSSNQDQVWIADRLVIDYKKNIKKHPETSSIPLKKGKHTLKIVYLNNIVNGWATDWNTVELKYKKESDSIFNIVDKSMIFYKNRTSNLSLK
ncbi:family 20 glycosylhydrolase [Aquimarina sp. 2201CG14-23]|uniref:family 20 glycosylhydrolase n=1 Tax=Aquimarina mycalae TaxID=3040073 RepID=UPI00247802C9|nr:family 20 glycosylhydrolase [Aquimarina sp. 2201CG14-23]MDH7444526.1 family 20 glycosylhydrolase [Aquimarina sp. 2201CG14-23]